MAKRMKLSNPKINRAGGWLLSQMLDLWMRTLSYRYAFYEHGCDPAQVDFQGPAIFLLWHEYIPFPFYMRPRCKMALLVSQHGDAELLSQAAAFRGFDTVRGSSTRGGAMAIKQLLSSDSETSLCITPDGPRGPRRKLAPGCVFLASRLGLPLIPLGFGYHQPWRYRRAWDQFAIPKPGSRARAIVGPKIVIPADIEREELEHWRTYTEYVLNHVTEAAEQWANDGLSRYGEKPLYVKRAEKRVTAILPPTTIETNEPSIDPIPQLSLRHVG
jgi:lysophospholipid acyltransferase (LPLAT)-like uncharacterized protein